MRTRTCSSVEQRGVSTGASCRSTCRCAAPVRVCGGRGETWTEPCAACRGTGDALVPSPGPRAGAAGRRRRRAASASASARRTRAPVRVEVRVAISRSDHRSEHASRILDCIRELPRRLRRRPLHHLGRADHADRRVDAGARRSRAAALIRSAGRGGGGQFAAGLTAAAFATLAVLAIVWGVAHVVVGVPLRRRRHWSRLAALMLGSVDLLLLPYGTALGVLRALDAARARTRKRLFEAPVSARLILKLCAIDRSGSQSAFWRECRYALIMQLNSGRARRAARSSAIPISTATSSASASSRTSTIDGGRVAFTIELTTPACPVKDQMRDQARAAVLQLPGVTRVDVQMTARVREAVGADGGRAAAAGREEHHRRRRRQGRRRQDDGRGEPGDRARASAAAGSA